ncbi:MAG: proline--tRNA ligase [Thermomicrobiales bacterium]
MSTTPPTAQDQARFNEELADIEDDFDRWYVEINQKAGLVDDAPIRGCKIIRPYGYALWEAVQRYLDPEFKQLGVTNAYFPMFIPRAFLAQEADHVEGFTPEVAWVTHGGGHAFPESEWWAVRPTSEAIIMPSIARWVQSYRDLPQLLNQWNTVFRWENRPRAWLRTSEFMWHEGHTAHASDAEAEDFTLAILTIFERFLRETLAIPTIPGRKSDAERFAGAQRTYSVEAMMGGKHWALQAGTSHYFGDNFGRAFDIQFLDRDGTRKHASTTSWAVSQRVIGATIMVHGDADGLILPPRIAPIQVIGVPIFRKDEERAQVETTMDAALAALKGAGLRTSSDWSDNRPGWKRSEWEMKGVPLRLEIGPRDIAAGEARVVRRDNREAQQIKLADLPTAIPALLDTIQADMLAKATAMLEAKMRPIDDYAEFKQVAANNEGWGLLRWCGNPACETQIKEETKATSRNLPLAGQPDPGPCVVCGTHADGPRWIFARAY